MDSLLFPNTVNTPRMNTNIKPSDISERLDQFFVELDDVCRQCVRDPKRISLVLATKYLNETPSRELLDIIRTYPRWSIAIGENRIQDAEKKFDYVKKIQPALLSSVRKILIGTLQKNKVNKAIELFDEIHSIDSLKLAECIDDRLHFLEKRMPVFLQINISGERSKHGVPIEEADGVITNLINRSHVDLKGLMTMAPFTSDQEIIKSVFRSLRQLADRYQLKTSMGMSSDWKIAVEEGSDILRIGSKVFMQPRKIMDFL